MNPIVFTPSTPALPATVRALTLVMGQLDVTMQAAFLRAEIDCAGVVEVLLSATGTEDEATDLHGRCRDVAGRLGLTGYCIEMRDVASGEWAWCSTGFRLHTWQWTAEGAEQHPVKLRLRWEEYPPDTTTPDAAPDASAGGGEW